MGTKIDPTACRADRLVGHVLGEIGTLPKIYEEIVINFVLFRHLIGVQRNPTQRDTRVCLFEIFHFQILEVFNFIFR